MRVEPRRALLSVPDVRSHKLSAFVNADVRKSAYCSIPFASHAMLSGLSKSATGCCTTRWISVSRVSGWSMGHIGWIQTLNQAFTYNPGDPTLTHPSFLSWILG